MKNQFTRPCHDGLGGDGLGLVFTLMGRYYVVLVGAVAQSSGRASVDPFGVTKARSLVQIVVTAGRYTVHPSITTQKDKRFCIPLRATCLTALF